MRLRRYANVEKLRSKERRLVEVLRRQEEQKILAMFPHGILPTTPLDYSASIGGSTVSIFTPIQALVHVPEMTFQVDMADTPDPTGGFADVVIGAGKQIGELRTDQTLSFAGRSSGTYMVYATHSLENENAETRFPPGKYAEGEGVFTEHVNFYSHGQPLGAAIPRNNYDSSLNSETVSEVVDRLTINLDRESNMPSTATPLLRIQWDGSQITSITNVVTVVDLSEVNDRLSDVESQIDAQSDNIDTLTNRVTSAENDISETGSDLDSHIGSGGSAHPSATPSNAGFMSSTDKSKLNSVESGAQQNPSGSQIFNDVLARDGSGSGLDSDRVDGAHLGDLVQRGNVNDHLYKGRVTSGGSADGLPAGWSVAKGATGEYIITYASGDSPQVLIPVPDFVGHYPAFLLHDSGNRQLVVEVSDPSGTKTDGGFWFMAV